jgi:hypothetical protein
MLRAPLLNTIDRSSRKVQKNGKTAKFRAQLQVLPIFVQQQRLFRWRHPPIQGRIRKSRLYNPSNKKRHICAGYPSHSAGQSRAAPVPVWWWGYGRRKF